MRLKAPGNTMGTDGQCHDEEEAGSPDLWPLGYCFSAAKGQGADEAELSYPL